MADDAEHQYAWLESRAMFVERLKSLRISSNLTQPALVDQVGSGLSVNAYKKYEWRNGQALADEDWVQQIVDVLGEDATDLIELRAKADTARGAWKHAQQFPEEPKQSDVERYAPWKGYTFRDLFNRSVDAIISTCVLVPSDHGAVIGWRHFLEDDRLPVTSMASSYGLRILIAANHAGSVPSIGQIRDSILRMELEGGGWNFRTQNRMARVEASGPILHALRLAGLPDEDLKKRVTFYEEILDSDFDPATWAHTTILTYAANTLSRVHPESFRLPQLLAALGDAVKEVDDEAWWTASLDGTRSEQLFPSVVHTARAVCCIAQAPPESRADLELTAVKAVRWLERQVKYHNSDELIERTSETDRDFLNMRHFTAAWVGRALALGSQWTEVRLEALHRAEDRILQAVGPDGLWELETGEKPIWMTFQGLRALRQISFSQHDILRSR